MYYTHTGQRDDSLPSHSAVRQQIPLKYSECDATEQCQLLFWEYLY